MTRVAAAFILRLMINRRIIFTCALLLAVAAGGAGCFWRNSEKEAPPPVTFHPVQGLAGVSNGQSADGEALTAVAEIERPLPPPDRPDDQLLYHLRVYYVVERVVEGRSPEGLWHLVDETTVEDSQRHLLRVNGMRVGVGGELSLERINAALRRRSGVEIGRAHV